VRSIISTVLGTAHSTGIPGSERIVGIPDKGRRRARILRLARHSTEVVPGE